MKGVKFTSAFPILKYLLAEKLLHMTPGGAGQPRPKERGCNVG